MVIDYLKLMLDNGFLLSNGNSYNDIELKVAIRLAFNQMTFVGKTEEGLRFISSDKKEYLAVVSDYSIIFSLDRLKTAPNLESQREFTIIGDKTGKFSFEQLLATSKGMLIVTAYINNDAEKRNIYADILGYDSMTINLFKEWLKKDYSDLYVSALEDFFKAKDIMPDISRRIMISEEENNLYFCEEDLVFDFKSKIFNHVAIPKSASLLTAIENIIRAKRYYDEMESLNGLSYSMEDKISKVLLSKGSFEY